MANDLNRCEFIGRLGADPEVKYTASGQAVCNLRLACGESYVDKNTQQKQEKTTWIAVTTWGKLAEVCGQYLSKGSQIYVAGRLSNREWEDKDGNKRRETEIRADQMQMLGSKKDGATPSQKAQSSNNSGSYGKQQEFDDIPF